MYNELQRIWKEVVMAWLVLTWHLFGGTGESFGLASQSQDQDMNLKPSKYEAGVITSSCSVLLYGFK